MKCTVARDLIEPYLDGELDPGLQAEIQDHLTTCTSCGETHSWLLQLQTDIRAQELRYGAPAQFQERIVDALRQAVRSDAATSGVTPRSVSRHWMAIAASILLAVSLSLNFTLFRSRNTGRDTISENILSSHVRSLIGSHLLDVASSDQHTVKPWFNGRIDFSPEVKDFASQGFPLIGGRLEYLADRPVAALVYQRRQHIINLFTWPSSLPLDREGELTRKGYNLIHWNHAGMTYWAVSDLRVSELRQFGNLYKE